MEKKEIVDRITSLQNVEKLNSMQNAMLDLKSKSVILLAPTGSGKTLAFTIRILENLTQNKDCVQAVVIAPSRELVMQTASVIRSVCSGWKVTALYGGHSVKDEVQSLTPAPSIIVATPGRLLDHLQRGNIEKLHPSVLVFDEYDKSLELGFEDEMKKIMRRILSPEHIVLTSATPLFSLPSYIPISDAVTVSYHEDPTHEVSSKIEIVNVESPSRDKLQTLSDLLKSLPNGKTIIFVGHRESAERIYQFLKNEKIPVGLYHGGLKQDERVNAIDLLENGTTPVLVATDLAARGLDIDSVEHIIHYHLPVDKETWIHRNGRTARQDATGTVYTITSEADSVPDFIIYDRPYNPTGKTPADGGIKSNWRTFYLNVGRKEKISRGDILGFLTSINGLSASEVGKIALHDHYALIALNKNAVKKLPDVKMNVKIKGKSARMTLLKAK